MALYGNEIFWVMAGIIGFLLVAVMRLAGALYRSRQIPVPVQAFASEGALEPARTARPVRGAQGTVARRRGGGRLLVTAGVLAAVLWAADKVLHFHFHTASAGTASPKPKVTAAPRPHPVAAHPAPKVPPAAVQAAHHWYTTLLAAVAHAAHSVPLGPAAAVIVVLVLSAYALRRRPRHP